MSIEALNWAFGLRLDDPMAKVTLLALANRHNPKNEICWPSLGLMSRETGAGVRTISRAVGRLERLGLVGCDRHARRSTEYLLRVNSWLPSFAFEAGADIADLKTIGIELRQELLTGGDNISLQLIEGGRIDPSTLSNGPPRVVTLATHPSQIGCLIIIEAELNLSENRRKFGSILHDFEMHLSGLKVKANGWTVLHADQAA